MDVFFKAKDDGFSSWWDLVFQISEGQRDFDYAFNNLTHEQIARRYVKTVLKTAKENYVPDDD